MTPPRVDRIGWGALLVAALVLQRSPVAGAGPCDVGPSRPPTPATANLEEDAAAWGISCEGTPAAATENVSSPSLDGPSLHLTLGGTAGYSNAHFYRTLTADAAARTFVLSLRFWFSATTLNNEGGPSAVQALEFAVDTWRNGARGELALQWENVGDHDAPRWRYWDPHRRPADRWVPLGIGDRLAPEQWHSLTVEGEVAGGQVHYTRFNIDQRCHGIDTTLPFTDAPGEPDRLAVTVQLDGSATQSPYSVYVDQLSFTRDANPAPAACGALEGRSIDAMESSREWAPHLGGGATRAALATVDGCQSGAIALDYDLGSTPGAWAQMRRDFNPPLDLSASDHVRFRYTGTRMNRLEVGMISTDGRIFFATPWKQATQVPWCSTATWDLRDFRSNGEPLPDLRRISAIFVSASNNDGGTGGTGRLVVDAIEGVQISTHATPCCQERAVAAPGVIERAAAWIGAQQTTGGLVKSWLEEPDDFAWLYDQGLSLLVLTETDRGRAASLASTLRGLQDADGSWYSGYHTSTHAPINGSQPIGAIAWATYALARFAMTTGDPAALASARAGGDWLARLQRPDGSLPAEASEFGSPAAPTEANLDAWWAFTATRHQAEADRLQDFLVTRVWDGRAGRFKSDADRYEIFLDNQTWGAAFLRAIGRDTDAGRALNYARWTLGVATAGMTGTTCGFDGAGPFAVWNQGTLQYVQQHGPGSQFYFDQMVAQQAADGGLPATPLPAALNAYIVWLSPWHGVTPTAWLYFAGTGGPAGW